MPIKGNFKPSIDDILDFRRDFVIYKIVGQPPVQITHNDFKKKVRYYR